MLHNGPFADSVPAHAAPMRYVGDHQADRARIQKLRDGIATELKALDEAGTQLLDIAQNLAIVTADITRTRSRLRGHLQAALLDEEIAEDRP
jgi:hypothetical protein